MSNLPRFAEWDNDVSLEPITLIESSDSPPFLKIRPIGQHGRKFIIDLDQCQVHLSGEGEATLVIEVRPNDE
jgi:hypothetical protein